MGMVAIYVAGLLMGAAVGIVGTLIWGYVNWRRQVEAQLKLAVLAQTERVKPRCKGCGAEYAMTQHENSLTREFCNHCMQRMDFSGIGKKN